MKTRELIRRLQEADPEGDAECVVGWSDIHYVETLPGYYDGAYETLIRDPAKAPYYNVVGVTLRRGGTKLTIKTLDATDVLFEDPDARVEFDDMVQAERRAGFLKWADGIRQRAHDVKNSVECGCFVRWAHARGRELGLQDDAITTAAEAFWRAHYTHASQMPPDLMRMRRTEVLHGQTYEVTPSWSDRRCLQYDREVAFTVQDAQPVFALRAAEPT